MATERGNPFAEDTAHRPWQFTLRSLLVFTFVACLAMSIGKTVGAILAALIGIQIILFKVIEADCIFNPDITRKPLLAILAFLAIFALPILFGLTILVAVAFVSSLFQIPL